MSETKLSRQSEIMSSPSTNGSKTIASSINEATLKGISMGSSWASADQLDQEFMKLILKVKEMPKPSSTTPAKSNGNAFNNNFYKKNSKIITLSSLELTPEPKFTLCK
jgi:hypothetical protein